ncbi:MAG: AAA-like domain-containing protein [Saprospiraceae bacterium]
MEKFFNTAGPIKKNRHYYVDSKKRWDFQKVLDLIEQEKYFILHAPRQTGKTSALLSLVDYLNDTQNFEAIYVNIEAAQAARENVEGAMQAITGQIASRHRLYLKNNLLKDNWLTIYQQEGYHQAVTNLLTFWAENATKPTVLFLDEVDALIGDTLISLLRQIRGGYDKRPAAFPISIILCGVRDIRDYRIHSSKTKEIITGGSAFNIKAESLRLENFSKEHIQDLYTQHTIATAQVFEEGILDLVWHYTQGQPWLVNALAYEATYNMRENRDRTKTITVADFKTAKERLILRRDTHLDQLTDKLQEDRVRRVIAPMLSGSFASSDHHVDDVQYVRDLGLINVTISGKISIANAIYQEVIPRELTWQMQTGMTTDHLWYIQPNGALAIDKLLRSFQDFFRQHSEHWLERYAYKEAGPQLLLQAYLQRIVNGGGRIEREYGFGRGRTDLFVEYFYGDNQKQAIVLELKILYNSLESTIEEGITQIKTYMDKCGTTEGHLLIFDRRTNRAWEEKIWDEQVEGIHIWGC